MLASGVTALILFPTRSKPEETDQENETARRQWLATEHDTTANARFQTALDACRGLPVRLTEIAEAAEANAATLGDAKEAGLIAAPHRISPEWRLPLGTTPRQPTAPRHRLAAPRPSLRPTHRHPRRLRRRSGQPRLRI
jgi:hypothetical protein